MMKRLMLMSLLAFLPGRPVQAQALEPSAQTAQIYYSSEEAKEATPERSAAWKEFCAKLSKDLSVSEGPLPGFLTKANCMPLGIKAPSGKSKIDGAAWRLQIVDRKRYFDLQADYFIEAEGYQKIKVHSFKMEGDLLSSLKGDIVPLTIARMLLESLPTGWVYTHDASHPDIVFKGPNELPGMPPDLLVYDLAYDTTSKRWQPTVRARLKRSDDRKKGKQRIETFKIAQSYLPLTDKRSYWVQSSRGLNVRQADYEKVLSKNMEGLSLLNFLDRLLFESFESNYAGFRYGRSFLNGSSIVTETSLFSLLVEMRSGLFNGLRYYYDMTPEKRKGSGDNLEYFSMSRGSLGWAFDFDLPAPLQLLASRVEVQPKFGLLDLKSHFSVIDENGTAQSLSFDARNVYDLAIELGVEKESYWFRSRIWGSFSAAAFGLSNKSNVSVLSTKAGLDTYFDLVKYGSWDINLLAFALAERLSLSKSDKVLSDDQDLGISAVTFNLFFIGGGFTISW